LFARVAYLQGERQPLLGPNDAERCRTPPDLPEQASFYPVSRQSALTSGVRKRLPFSLCKRPEVSPPLVTLPKTIVLCQDILKLKSPTFGGYQTAVVKHLAGATPCKRVLHHRI